MIKKIGLTLILTIATLSSSFGGGLLTNTNQSVHFLRNPARGASTEIDAIYTNPAGLAKLNNGWHFSITNQSAFQTRVITSTSPLFVGRDGKDTKRFKGSASAPIVPSVMGAYSYGKWTISASFAITGGGGKATFNDGLPSFESMAAMGPVAISQLGAAVPQAGYKATRYSADQYMTGTSFIYGTQLGATYMINDMFSVYGGFRLNIVRNGYDGYMRELRVNLESNIGHNGSMIYTPEIFEAMYDDAVSKEDMTSAALFNVLRHASSDQGAIVDVKQTGWGISPIIGFHFSHAGLDVGAKFEFRTRLNVENKTKRDDTGMFKKGVNTPHDIPSLLTLGASYQIIKQLKISAGYHYFFDSKARMDKGKQKYISGGTNEYLFGVEYQITPRYMISAGGQITRQGVKDGYQSDLSFALNSYSVGVGGAVNITPKVRLNIAYFWTNYSKWNKLAKSPTALISKDVFQRTNKVFGVGVDFSL